MNRKLTLVRGDSKSYPLLFHDGDDVALDITGWLVRFTLKTDKTLSDSEASLIKIVSSHSSPTTGVTAIDLTPADTIDLAARQYVFDIQVTTNLGKVYTVLVGRFVLEEGTSRGTSGTSGA